MNGVLYYSDAGDFRSSYLYPRMEYEENKLVGLWTPTSYMQSYAPCAKFQICGVNTAMLGSGVVVRNFSPPISHRLDSMEVVELPYDVHCMSELRLALRKFRDLIPLYKQMGLYDGILNGTATFKF